MSLNDILSAANSGLAASQAGLSTTANNIANVNTPGYARQKAVVATNIAAGRTSGVVVGEPERVADKFLESTVYRRTADAGQAEVKNKYLDQLQSLLGAPRGNLENSTNASAVGLPAQLDELIAAAIKMTGASEPDATSNAFVNSAKTVLQGFAQFESDVDGLRANVASEVSMKVDRINTLLNQVDGLNSTIAQSLALGRTTSGPADERMAALEELSGLMNVTITEQANGKVTIETPNGQALLDSRVRQLSYANNDLGAQSSYPDIEIRFADANGNPGPATGQTLEGGSVGGTLGGLLELRDKTLPAYQEQAAAAMNGLASTLNEASNAGTTVPAPASLTGRPSGLTADDRAGFTGKATFAVTAASGTVVARTDIDFDALDPDATIQDVLDLINTNLGGAATASMSANGTLTFATPSGSANGVIVAQDPTSPSSRGGVGFSQYFGLNDMIRSDTSPLVPSGFSAADETGFAAGETAQVVLRDPTGRELASYTLTGAAGQTFGDVVTGLNGSPLAAFGSFALDTNGRIAFTPTQAAGGVTLSIPADSTDRKGTGLGFTALSGLVSSVSSVSSAKIRPDLTADPTKLPLAHFQSAAAVGDKGIGKGDTTGAASFIDALNKTIDFGKSGKGTVNALTNKLFANIGAEAAQASDTMTDVTARRDDAITRRDSFSGVNVDEELATMVVLQNSYSAAARVMTTASDMYDALINMVN